MNRICRGSTSGTGASWALDPDDEEQASTATDIAEAALSRSHDDSAPEDSHSPFTSHITHNDELGSEDDDLTATPGVNQERPAMAMTKGRESQKEAEVVSAQS